MFMDSMGEQSLKQRNVEQMEITCSTVNTLKNKTLECQVHVNCRGEERQPTDIRMATSGDRKETSTGHKITKMCPESDRRQRHYKKGGTFNSETIKLKLI